MKTHDVGDVAVSWEWSGDEVVILAMAPHFEDAELPTEEDAAESIREHEAERYADLESAAWDARYDAFRDGD